MSQNIYRQCLETVAPAENARRLERDGPIYPTVKYNNEPLPSMVGMMGEGSDPKLLWQNVIIRAVLDAESATATHRDTHDCKMAAYKARIWLMRNSPDFREVCELAGFDPDFVSEAFRNGKLTAQTLAPEDSVKRLPKENRTQKGDQRDEKIVQLAEKGFSRRSIREELGCSQRTVTRVLGNVG